MFPDESSEKRPASTIVVPPLEPDRKKDQLPASALRLNEFGACGKAVPLIASPLSNPISRTCPDARMTKRQMLVPRELLNVAEPRPSVPTL